MDRESGLQLLQEYVDSPNLLKHALAVEAGMRGYAKVYQEDVERWGLIGLLHDIDYQQYPEEHPLKGVELLAERGFDQEFTQAVKAHADGTNTPRETLIAKALYAVDELSSFLVACVLVRPDRDFNNLKLKSVKKKLKDKAFAKGVDREIVKRGAEELGVPLEEHIQTLIEALTVREGELQQSGLSLIE